MSARIVPPPAARAAGEVIPTRLTSFPLFGRSQATGGEAQQQADARLHECSAALLSLYAPCAPADFPQRAAAVVREILPAGLVTFAQVDLHTGAILTRSLGDVPLRDLPLGREEIDERWRNFAHEHPIVRAHLRGAAECVATYALEDVLPAASRRGLAIDEEFFQPLGIRHQLAVLFPGSDLAAGVFISRATGFAESERRLLGLIGPHLAQAFHRHLLLAAPEARPAACRYLAWERLRSAGYSRRECEILQWLSEGKSDDDIAVILGLSRKTVSNQVFDLMHKLGAHNRIAAVIAALQFIETPPPFEMESQPQDREAEFQAQLVKLAGAPTPADVLQHLRQILGLLWPGLELEAWLVRVEDEQNRFAPLAPGRVRSYAERMALHGGGVGDDTRPVLGAAHDAVGAVRYLPLPPSAYVWENRAAPAGELLAALVLVPERIAFAIVAGSDARSFGAQRLADWHRLAPHLLVACRSACRLVDSGSGPLVPTPPPGAALWQTLSGLGLTDRQVETVAWLAVGASDQEIAERLDVSVRTIHAHLRAIFEILGVENRLAAVLAACRHFTRHLAFEGE